MLYLRGPAVFSSIDRFAQAVRTASSFCALGTGIAWVSFLVTMLPGLDLDRSFFVGSCCAMSACFLITFIILCRGLVQLRKGLRKARDEGQERLYDGQPREDHPDNVVPLRRH